jgi:hypothetical protein
MIDNRLVVIFEHQSTLNENMPFRIFNYIQRLYSKTVNPNKLFNEKLIKIPKPEVIVLYNGKDTFPDKKELKLSDAFMVIEGLAANASRISLELVVQVYNINHGKNPEIQQKCQTLNNYSFLIGKIREYEKTGLLLDKSVESAVKYCLENNILKDFLREYGSEVVDMLFLDYDLDDHLAARYREGREDEREERDQTIACNLIAEGSSLEFIQKITGLAPEVIRELKISKL